MYQEVLLRGGEEAMSVRDYLWAEMPIRCGKGVNAGRNHSMGCKIYRQVNSEYYVVTMCLHTNYLGNSTDSAS